VLAALAHLPDSRDRQIEAFDARIELRHVVFPCRRFDEIGTILDGSLQLAETLEDEERVAIVLGHQ
jgi:hypothetical protein